MPRDKPDMVKGTLDMLILKVVSLAPAHGWAITERIQEVSDDELRVNQGSLYASLTRLTRAGWIRSRWRVTENNRRARYYELTARGASQLGLEEEHWARLTRAVQSVLSLTPEVV